MKCIEKGDVVIVHTTYYPHHEIVYDTKVIDGNIIVYIDSINCYPVDKVELAVKKADRIPLVVNESTVREAMEYDSMHHDYAAYLRREEYCYILVQIMFELQYPEENKAGTHYFNSMFDIDEVVDIHRSINPKHKD